MAVVQGKRLDDDAVIHLDEWYSHFDDRAREDPDCKDNDAASSVVVAKELTFLETQAGLLAAPKTAAHVVCIFCQGVWLSLIHI